MIPQGIRLSSTTKGEDVIALLEEHAMTPVVYGGRAQPDTHDETSDGGHPTSESIFGCQRPRGISIRGWSDQACAMAPTRDPSIHDGLHLAAQSCVKLPCKSQIQGALHGNNCGKFVAMAIRQRHARTDAVPSTHRSN